MQRLKWGEGVKPREREKLDKTLIYDGIIRQSREGAAVKESDKWGRRGGKCLPL